MKKPLRATLKRGSMAGVATVGAAALLLTGCGAGPGRGSTATATASDYTGCIVSDSGGFDDQSFNQSSYEGLKKAEKDLGIKVNQVESKTNNDFEPNLRAMVTAGCDLTVTVGFLLGDATKAAGHGEPGQALRDHRLRLRDAHHQRQADHLRHGAGRVPGRLPRRRHHQDRHGGAPSAASRSPPSPSSWTASPTA